MKLKASVMVKYVFLKLGVRLFELLFSWAGYMKSEKRVALNCKTATRAKIMFLGETRSIRQRLSYRDRWVYLAEKEVPKKIRKCKSIEEAYELSIFAPVGSKAELEYSRLVSDFYTGERESG